MNDIAIAVNVPDGMEVLGFFNSPETFAPAMIPVTPAKRTPKTTKNETGAFRTSQSLSNVP